MADDKKLKEKKESEKISVFNSTIDKMFIRMSKLHKILNLDNEISHLGEEEKIKYLREINEIITKNNMSGYYKSHMKKHVNLGPNEIEFMNDAVNHLLEELDLKIDAEDQAYDTFEKKAFLLKKAKILAAKGAKEEAMKVYKKAVEAAQSANNKIAVVFEILKFAIFIDDFDLFLHYIQVAKDIKSSETIDWEKKNTLRVYLAISHTIRGELKDAAEQFIECISTFSSEDVFPFADLIFYAVVLSVATLDRPDLESKIMESPEVMSALDDTKNLRLLLDSVYNCKYANFFKAIDSLNIHFHTDRFLGKHIAAYQRQAKKVVYKQYLEPYLSVTLTSVAAAFCVPDQFIDNEFYEYIANGEIEAKIDKINGIVLREAKDKRNELFCEIVSRGDGLAHRIERLKNLLVF